MSETRGKQQIVVIDAVRFIAAMIVVFFHLGFVIAVVPDNMLASVARGAVDQPLFPTFSVHGWVGVQVFFVVSGIVISYSSLRADGFGFFRSRVLRLVPTAWICSTLTLLVLAVNQSHVRPFIPAYLHSMLFVPWSPWIDGSFWTLSIEISFYALVAVLIFRKAIASMNTLAVWLTVISLAYWVAFTVAEVLGLPAARQGLFGAGPWHRVAQLLLLEHGALFALGVFISRTYIEKAKGPSVAVLAAALLSSSANIYWSSTKLAEKLHIEGNFVIPLAVWVVCVGMIVVGIVLNEQAHKARRIVPVLRIVGLMTYPLYLLHMMVGGVLIGTFARLGIGARGAQALSVLLLLLCTYLIVVLAEPPVRRAMSRIIDGTRGYYLSRKVLT